jgi:hypothetical protein
MNDVGPTVAVMEEWPDLSLCGSAMGNSQHQGGHEKDEQVSEDHLVGAQYYEFAVILKEFMRK